MSLHAQVRERLQNALAQPADDSVAQLDDALRLLSKWRSVLIQNTLLQQQGTVVMEGPLAGLDFLPRAIIGDRPRFSCPSPMTTPPFPRGAGFFP
jgi:hypothetical protein